MLGTHRNPPYEQSVMGTRPVFYVPLTGDPIPAASTGKIELVRRVKLEEQAQAGAALPIASGALPGSAPNMLSGTTEYWRVATDTSYHPGDTFSVGGWFNRTGAGSSSPSMLHLGSGDLVVWFSSDQLTLRKAGTGDIYVIGSPTFPTPYTAGWQHIIFTKNGTSASNICTAYLNGALVSATYTNRTIVAAASNIGIGLNGANTNFTGMMQHWAIWNRVLTFGEARELYMAGRDAVA